MTRFAWAAVGLLTAGAAVGSVPPEPSVPREPEVRPKLPDPTAPWLRFGESAHRERLNYSNGGDGASLVAAAKGLAWLARQQKVGGRWEHPAGSDEVAATGLALLPFVGAGQTHRSGGKYTKVISDGLKFLVGGQDAETGGFAATKSCVVHALATAVLCDTFRLTRDGAYRAPARAAVGFLVRAREHDGGWAPVAGVGSTLEATGWALWAVRAADRAGIDVPAEVPGRAMRFLDGRADGPFGTAFAAGDPADARPGTMPTAIGLAARLQFDGWGPSSRHTIAGSEGLLGDIKAGVNDRSRAPRTWGQLQADRTPPDPLWAFHATRVMFAAGGRVWIEWNEGPSDAAGRRLGGMRDWLVMSQSQDGNDTGSWDAPPGPPRERWGRIGATALNVLTLEVYYRDPPLDPRPPAP